MEVAYTSWNLQDLSGGRFTLGLGTQVRAHVERRYGVPWTRPAARMREYVLALRAIWSAWETGEPLHFEGEFSSHTLMPPAFRPRPQPHGAPPVWLAAVRERMIEVAGEVADGLLVHPLQSPRYLEEVVRPALARGAARAGRDPSDIGVSVAQLVATTPAELEAVRARVAFYGSTPGYRHVLALHGLDDLFGELHELSRTGGWDRMSALVDDDTLRTFAAYAESPAGARGGPAPADGRRGPRCAALRGRGGPGVMVRHRPRAQVLASSAIAASNSRRSSAIRRTQLVELRQRPEVEVRPGLARAALALALRGRRGVVRLAVGAEHDAVVVACGVGRDEAGAHVVRHALGLAVERIAQPAGARRREHQPVALAHRHVLDLRGQAPLLARGADQQLLRALAVLAAVDAPRIGLGAIVLERDQPVLEERVHPWPRRGRRGGSPRRRSPCAPCSDSTRRG